MYDDNNDGGMQEFQERGAQEQQEAALGIGAFIGILIGMGI